MADCHEHSNFLLKAVDLGLFARTRSLLELLDCGAFTRGLLDTEAK
jgi:hypothetical protein